MKKYIIAAALLVGTLVSSEALAQTGPAGPGGPVFESSKGQATPRKRKASAKDIARMQRRMSMNPNEVKRDQQIEVLEARGGGNSSYGSGSRAFERGSGGFVVKRFRDKRAGAMQKRGMTRAAPGIDPPGKPLVRKSRRGFHYSK
ncbi:hypothetical protein [Hymenobacter sp. BT730]|uniref:hypothetical protein n=1 Tax=Hymenobacter sp. BT730 TaxID=3063332 RepID=UPI0026E0DE74|nr:hypothetical protein [Hymenobacter sp. BT730]